jgi:hypothetical protein
VRLPVELLDNATGEFVEAELFDEITVEHFLETKRTWRPLVLQARRKLLARGREDLVPNYAHWDWTTKEPLLQMLAMKFFGIECGGKLQGIVEIQMVGYECRVPTQRGRDLVYVDYLQVAPWNVRLLMDALGKPTQFRGVGSRLFEAIVRFSFDEGFKGRVGLHSLPSSEAFYTRECGMTAAGRDRAKQNLLWCEFTPEQAQTFLTGGAR